MPEGLLYISYPCGKEELDSHKQSVYNIVMKLSFEQRKVFSQMGKESVKKRFAGLTKEEISKRMKEVRSASKQS